MIAIKTPNPERLIEALQNIAFGIKTEQLTIGDIGGINLSIAEELTDLLEMIFEYHACTVEGENIEDNVIQKNLMKARLKADQLAEIGRYLSRGETLFSFEKRMKASKDGNHES